MITVKESLSTWISRRQVSTIQHYSARLFRYLISGYPTLQFQRVTTLTTKCKLVKAEGRCRSRQTDWITTMLGKLIIFKTFHNVALLLLRNAVAFVDGDLAAVFSGQYYRAHDTS